MFIPYMRFHHFYATVCAMSCRHVCRGAKVNQLSSQVFWFNRPALLLHPIKYLLFLCSFMFASAVSNQRA